MSEAPDPAPRRAPRRRRGPVATILLSLIATGVEALLLALALGGFGALVAHTRAMALIAVWAVSGVALALRKPVRDQDVVDVVPESPMVLAGLASLPGGTALRWAGVALVAAGLALRIAAMSQLGPRFSPRVALQREHPLETRGLYARVRHPGYLGAWLAALGALLAFGSVLGLLPLLPFTWLMAARARREERLLEARFGDAFRDYRSRTGAFLPGFWPRPRG